MGRKRRTIPWLDLRDETYYVFWTDEETGKTKRLSLRTTDSLEAQQRYAAFLTEGHGIFNPKPGGLTVSQALDQYLLEHVERNVIARDRQHCAAGHLKSFFKDTPLSEIDIPASRAYAEARRRGDIGKRPGADSTIRRELVVLVAAANHARKWKRISSAEMPSIELPHEAHHEARWLTKDELRRVIDECEDPRLKAFIQIAYYTAGRRQSIETLRKEQIDLRQSRINLRAPTETALQRKSKKRRPIVPLHPAIRPVVERLMMESPNEWLFGDTKSLYHRFADHMERLGLGDKGNPHILRHSRATHLLQDGVPMYDVARLLGDTIATVDSVYGHHSPEHLAEALMGSAI
jgi:integrase